MSSQAVLKSGEQTVARITPRTESGRVGKVQEGSIVATSSAEGVVTPGTPSVGDDGVISIPYSWAGPGSAQVTFSADADLGDGVTTITGIGTITCLEEEAETLEINFDAPTPVAPPAAPVEG